MSVSKAEPVMLEQISRISQQIGYYLHRASMRGSGVLLSRELHPVAPLLDNLISALNKVYQRKGVNISMDISPEISFVGEQNDFVEVMGNVLDNACKYCTEFVEISARQTDDHLHIFVEDDGPAFPTANVPGFDRGQRADTLRPTRRGAGCHARDYGTIRRADHCQRQSARRRPYGGRFWPTASHTERGINISARSSTHLVKHPL